MALTASALPALGIVKLALNWAPYFGELVSIYRIEPDGTQVEVLGSPVALSGSDAIIYDTTAPLDVNLTYQAVLTNPAVLRDGFGRTTASSWGTPEFSTATGLWINTGTNSDYNTASGAATQKHTNVALGRHSVTPGSYQNVRISATTSIPVNPLGAGIRHGAMTRYVDQNNHYQFNIVQNTGGAITLNILRRVSGSDTIIATSATPFTANPNRQFRLVAESNGTRHRMTVWGATGQVDAVTLEVSDSTFTAAGPAGLRSILLTGNTNTLPVSVTYDNVLVEDLSTYTLTSVAASVAAAPHGWVRDPLVPGNSIRLDNCASHTFDCLDGNQMVFFQGFGDEDYASKSGVFEVSNAERPVVVAQRRKDVVTDLRFASVSLTDITRVRTLFKTGRNLALSLDPDYGWGLDAYGTAMFTAGDLKAARLNPRDMRKPYRLWTTEVAVTDLDDDLPHGTVGGNNIPIPGATFGDLKATGKTFGQLKATLRPTLNTNPFFETNTASWTPTGGTFVRSTAQFHEGVASGLLTPDGVTSEAQVLNDRVTATVGTTYRVQGWLRCAVARNVKFGVNWHLTGVFVSDSTTTIAVAANTWTFFDFTATAPNGANQVQWKASLTGTPPASNLLYVDEAKLAKAISFLDWAQGVN